MQDVYLAYNLNDNGGRRTGFERRRFSYAAHIPERRCGVDRRTGTYLGKKRDRRSDAARRWLADRRSATDVDRRAALITASSKNGHSLSVIEIGRE